MTASRCCDLDVRVFGHITCSQRLPSMASPYAAAEHEEQVDRARSQWFQDSMAELDAAEAKLLEAVTVGAAR